jgi:hypothetical protein
MNASEQASKRERQTAEGLVRVTWCVRLAERGANRGVVSTATSYELCCRYRSLYYLAGNAHYAVNEGALSIVVVVWCADDG